MSTAINAMHRLFQCALALAALATTSIAVADNKLSDTIQIGNQSLQLCGEVTLRALGIFKFGYGGLYLGDCADYKNVTGDIPKQWSVLLTRDAKGSKLTEIAEDTLADNFSEQALAELDDVFNCMTSAYQDTPDGGQVDVRYLPGTGLQLIRNDEITADCGGDAKAAGYFNIWFGEEPFNDSMKEKIFERSLERTEKNELSKAGSAT